MIDILKVQALCDLITLQQQERLKIQKLDCQCNIDLSKAHYHIKKKYTYIDIGTSGRYMINNLASEIYGVKAYGVININHYFGNLDTINNYDWGYYQAILKNN